MVKTTIWLDTLNVREHSSYQSYHQGLLFLNIFFEKKRVIQNRGCSAEKKSPSHIFAKIKIIMDLFQEFMEKSKESGKH